MKGKLFVEYQHCLGSSSRQIKQHSPSSFRQGKWVNLGTSFEDVDVDAGDVGWVSQEKTQFGGIL